ncbi:polysaccharide biosynthesis/export family protein [Flavobacterium saccharophilum]|uniref:Polysaccharide export outer membrane protein n=1 Tax=Flavobacterium saccharophilum TaxID=29534 RepID=A0A1M7IQ77_9FLAO|nr:polysaccharide biosynthesis/export family protein [Flavobacterium saccharophilum]SHM42841.1 polysaccharide export outer membrane protein [Flavobacterium saccharophilum]
MKKIFLSIILLLFLMLQSCTTKKNMLYLQDLDNYANSNLNYTSSKIQPNDILKVEVGDLNPLVAAPFNINTTSTSQTSVEMMRLSGYLVTPQGNITMPILNEIKVGGLTPANAEIKIKERLVNEGYLVNPTVQVRVLNNKFTILGEVNAPGVISFSEESISLLDAIGLAKDLTYSAIRKDVKLIREQDGKRLVYHIDLTTAAWMSNPNFRIRQNDVIVVTPNKLKVNSGGLIKDPIQLLAISASILTVILLLTD